MYKDLTLQDYLDTILSKEQQHILAYCLKNDVRVCLTDSTGGKLAIANLFKKTGYSVNNGSIEGVMYIIGIAKESFTIKRFEKFFTVKDIKRWLRKKYDRLRHVSEEVKKENAELKRQLEERQIIYEPIANEIIEIFAKYRIEFWEVTGLLELVKLKCQHQNSDKSLG